MKIVKLNTPNLYFLSHCLFVLALLGLFSNKIHANSLALFDSIPSKIFASFDQEPTFPGGIEALLTFFSKNFKEPDAVKSSKVSGSVIVKFIVAKDGSVLKPTLEKGIGGGVDEEMLRVTKLMPKWKPAQIKGKPVDAYWYFARSFNTTMEGTDDGLMLDVVEEPPMPIFGQTAPASNTDEVFKVVEVMPVYPLGQAALLQYLSNSIEYPQIAKENGVVGFVVVQMIVEKDGSLSNLKVVKGIGAGCDEEALRIIRLMPKWKPGFQNGQAVRVQYNLPIRFKLE